MFLRVTWVRAFRGALAYVFWMIIWALIGGAIVGVGIATGVTWTRRPLGPIEIPFPLFQWGIMAPLMIIGYIIVVLGVMTAFFKILAEITAEEVEKRVKTVSE